MKRKQEIGEQAAAVEAEAPVTSSNNGGKLKAQQAATMEIN